MDEYDRRKLASEETIFFVCSTTGQGDEPDNMKAFWKFLLRKSIPSDALATVKFALFGLGDSSYPKFNFPAKKLYKRLIQIGAVPLVPRGDGDDQHYLGIDGTLDPWLESLWSNLDVSLPLPKGLEIIPNDFLSEAPKALTKLVVVENTRITSQSHFQDIRLIKLRSDADLNFRPADVAWNEIADKPIRLNPNRTGMIFNDFQTPVMPKIGAGTLTIRVLLEKYLDIFGILSYFAADPLHADKLKEFASAAGQEELYNYCLRLRRTSFEVLQDFNSVKIPINYLLDCFRSLRPRSYSISNSPAVQSSEMDLVVGIVKYRTKMAIPRTGVCSKWLADVKVGEYVAVHISKGSLTLPPSLTTPVIFIATGTGIAPIRGLIQHRILSGATRNYLFAGFRNKNRDYMFEKEWADYTHLTSLTVHTAFSRDQDKKVYIQDIIQSQSLLVFQLLQEGAYVYFSGNAKKIPEDVRTALIDVCEVSGNMTNSEAKAYIENMEKSRRFQIECWT
ncbi:hypothetical protein BC829DRAFT_394306 [Chytridium lagenaria]|nr:hypothetical protein BC829DRAFT_394306 [Chytridium lagenaria]